MAAQLDHAGQLAGIIDGTADRFGSEFVDSEHAGDLIDALRNEHPLSRSGGITSHFVPRAPFRSVRGTLTVNKPANGPIGFP
jgi:hypothetical protein